MRFVNRSPTLAGSADEGYDYGVASEALLFQSDCAGKLEFEDELPPFEWSGYLVNYTLGLFVDELDYYERSRIRTHCLVMVSVLRIAAFLGCSSFKYLITPL